MPVWKFAAVKARENTIPAKLIYKTSRDLQRQATW